MKISTIIGRMLWTRAKMERAEKLSKRSINPVMDAFRAEVRKRWVDSGMNQTDFGHMIGLTGKCGEVRLSYFLSGQRGLHFPTVVHIANVLEIDLGELQRRFK